MSQKSDSRFSVSRKPLSGEVEASHQSKRSFSSPVRDQDSSKENFPTHGQATSPSRNVGRVLSPSRIQAESQSSIRTPYPSQASHGRVASTDFDSYAMHNTPRHTGRGTIGIFDSPQSEVSEHFAGPTKTIPLRQGETRYISGSAHEPQSAVFSSVDSPDPESPREYPEESFSSKSRHSSHGSIGELAQPPQIYIPFQYHHQQRSTDESLGAAVRGRTIQNETRAGDVGSPGSSSSGERNHQRNQRLTPSSAGQTRSSLARPASVASLGSNLSAHSHTRSQHLRGSPGTSREGSGNSRPLSYVDLLNGSYPQHAPGPTSQDNSHLRTVVGKNASLLETKQTLEMYRANVKKTNEPSIQYEFAVFLTNSAQELAAEASVSPAKSTASNGSDKTSPAATRAEYLREARQILQKLSDRSYPFAQYYLADGYASGIFNKDQEDYEKAFPLFVAASKHGHAEAGYRAALCYEFGWGCRRDPAKAEQFYRQSASKSHPGAMLRLGKACLSGDMGLGKRYREGIKWLKRAAESADPQYNSAPYELGTLHETGYGPDVFKDEAYAAQLFTQSADLGHPEAGFRLGEAYEYGQLGCPRDPALSVHFYNGAAQRGHPMAMMALCAWYMIGAEPVLDKDENEAYEWARKAAETGVYPKAEYAVGYFKEMGIGCRRDTLDANVWYVKAASHGDERAKQRLAIIQAAASGETAKGVISTGEKSKSKKGSPVEMEQEADGKNCIIM